MAEYIDRGALLEKATNGIVAAIDVLYAPAADVAPVVHGEWIGVRNGKGICSNCNRLDGIDPLATHCRYCGADMRERKGDGNG